MCVVCVVCVQCVCSVCVGAGAVAVAVAGVRVCMCGRDDIIMQSDAPLPSPSDAMEAHLRLCLTWTRGGRQTGGR